ncbi:DUF5605 domain-containing protein [Brevundimonas sp.]|uniref:DUF5605 domain-containing protein n=1 Tax=Brevundimonas sp. TaxID=1871086 RepID=UPI003783D05B
MTFSLWVNALDANQGNAMKTGITRRETLTVMTAGAAALAGGTSAVASTAIQRWGLHEIVLTAPGGPRPFDVRLEAVFSQGATSLVIPGFYDGDDVWRIRFSPPDTGEWRWRARSDQATLDGAEGVVDVGPATGENHGPVGVTAGYHFAYADGTPFRQVGTTSYGWTHQPPAKRQETLATLRSAPFNKIRMLVFPNTSLTTNEALFPFARTGDGDRDWDPATFNPAFFRRLEQCVSALGDLGIQADLILFHPYDGKFGLDEMKAEDDVRYVRYVTARLAAYRNVWWSLANEYDILKSKTEADWDRLFQVVRDHDPYGRLRSIHNWRVLYDNGKPWVTHSSIQNGSAVLDDTTAETYRSVWKKAVVFDEVCYEGSLDERWGNLTGQEMVRAFWHGLVAGTYVGHSECFPVGGGFWLGEGGTLRGESWPRLAFLKSVMEAGPRPGIEPIDKWWDQHLGGAPGQYYLRYFGDETPTEWAIDVPRDGITGGERFHVDVIDTWNMRITRQPDVLTLAKKDGTKYFFHDPARPTVTLPGRSWMAIRLERAT